MADENYKIVENPVYNPTLRELQDTDTASADNTFNPLFEQMLNNIHALRSNTPMPSTSQFFIEINFNSAMLGQPVTIACNGWFDVVIVPKELIVTRPLPKGFTDYTVAHGGILRRLRIEGYFGVYPMDFSMLSSFSWEEISIISKSGEAKNYFNIGDEKDIVLGTGDILTLQIYGFKHDDLLGGAKAGITFGMKHLMSSIRPMNSKATNNDGFQRTEMYGWLIGTVQNALPEALQKVMKPAIKATSAGDLSENILTHATPLFLFSEVECTGIVRLSATGEGKQYPIFDNEDNRAKRLGNGTGHAMHWWLRSPTLSSIIEFCLVAPVGNIESKTSAGGYGVCFGFCV